MRSGLWRSHTSRLKDFALQLSISVSTQCLQCYSTPLELRHAKPASVPADNQRWMCGACEDIAVVISFLRHTQSLVVSMFCKSRVSLDVRRGARDTNMHSSLTYKDQNLSIFHATLSLTAETPDAAFESMTMHRGGLSLACAEV